MFSWLFGDEHRANLALGKALARAYVRIEELKLENARLTRQLEQALEIHRDRPVQHQFGPIKDIHVERNWFKGAPSYCIKGKDDE